VRPCIRSRFPRKETRGRDYFKGGVVIELRFAGGARATKDLDIGMAGESVERLERFRVAMDLGFYDFTFEVKSKPIKMERIDTIRLELSVRGC
jgi:hypothetical protein